MKNTFTFTPTSITANGKTFPACYALQGAANMKRGQHLPVVHIFATVDDKDVKIHVPTDDE